MDETQRQLRTQWILLIALTAAHFVLDCFPGLMHTVLPAFQQSFHLSVSEGAVLLTVFLIPANGIQVLIGRLRAENDKPLFLYAGLVAVCAIVLFGIVPADGTALLWLCLISLVCGAGVGMTHPECLKAIHRLDSISPAVSSSVFMAGGVIGFAFSSWTSTHWFERWGFGSLVPFCVAAVIVLAVLLIFGIRLAVERDEPTRKAARKQVEPISFWMIMAVATLAACSVQVLAWIVPQRVEELRLNLTFGGAAVSMYSLAGGIGGIVMSRFAAKHGELRLIRWMLAAGIPFLAAYLFFLPQPWSPMLLFVSGFFCFGAYPLMVSAARHSEGPNLGQRMGLIVGGIWLVACVLPMLLGPVAEHVGTLPILFCVPVGFVLSLLLAVMSQKKKSRKHLL